MNTRRLGGLIVSACAALGFALLLLAFTRGGERTSGLAAQMIGGSVAASGSINVVTTVLLDFRAFDTLGEASVIFASVSVISAVFAGSILVRSDFGLGLLVRRAVAYLAALFLLFPAYIILHGHLSPGGGFQGGVSLAVALILLTVVFGTRNMSNAVGHGSLNTTESLSAAGFLLVGFVGVFQGVHFLTNAAAGFSRGDAGTLLSGGAIPLLNIIIGLKVASGLGSIFFDLLSKEKEC